MAKFLGDGIRRLALALIAALALAACGDDSGGSGEAAPVLCEIGEEIEALIDPTTPEEAEE